MKDPEILFEEITNEITAKGQLFETREYVDTKGITHKEYASFPDNLRGYFDFAMLHAEKEFLVYESERFLFKDVVAKATEKALVDFKNPYDSSKTSVTHGGGVSNDTDVGFNRMRSPGTTIKVMTCITTPCTGTMCTVPNHLCSKDITIN